MIFSTATRIEKSRRRGRAFFFGLKAVVISILLSPKGVWALAPSELLVLYNQGDAESRLIARDYAEVRKIPDSNMLSVTCTAEKYMDRGEFRALIAAPVRQFLTANPHIKYLVTIRGLPAVISSARPEYNEAAGLHNYDGAALESELMNVLKVYSSSSGWNKRSGQATDAQGPHREIIALRLDGPGVREIKNAVLAGVALEKEGGPKKWLFFRDTTSMGRSDYSLYASSMEFLYERLSTMNTGISLQNSFVCCNGESQKCDTNAVVFSLSPERGQPCKGHWGALWLGIHPNLETRSPKATSQHPGFYLSLVHTTYIKAYPLPHHVGALLLSGRYSLGEIVRQLWPYSSWQLVMVGDPLYNPYGKNPVLELDEMNSLMKGTSGP